MPSVPAPSKSPATSNGPAKKPNAGHFKPGNQAAVGHNGPMRKDPITQVLISQLNEIDKNTGKQKLHMLCEALIGLAIGLEFKIGSKKYQFAPDIKAIKEIIDRVQGRAIQSVGLTGPQKITFVFEPGEDDL